MGRRDKTKFEKWFSFSRHKRRVGGRQYFKDLDIDFQKQKKQIIIGNKKRNEVIDYIEKISKKIGKSINILIFSELEWSMMAKRDKPFFERV